MNREEIINAIRHLASEENFYQGLYRFVSDHSEDAEEFLEMLESKHFESIEDIISYFES